MEALYSKLYEEYSILHEKYSKLKSNKENEIDQINREQEHKFVEFVTAAETLIEGLTSENKILSESIDELRNEVVSVRNAKDQQLNDLQEELMEEKRKNNQLSAEIQQLRNLQKERNDEHDERHLNSKRRSPSVSRVQTDESPPMRMTRKRARLLEATDPDTSSPSVGRAKLSLPKESSKDQSKKCCQGIVVDGGPCKCLFQVLLECLISMKVSIQDQSDGKCIRAVHQSSGYSFNLTWVNTPATNEGELSYHINSLGTFATLALEWMKEDIVFSMNMCPIFFERLSRVIKQH